MILLFTGTERLGAVRAWRQELNQRRAHWPARELWFEADNFNLAALLEAALTNSLFGGRNLLVCRDLAPVTEVITEALPLLAASPHWVIWLETGENNPLIKPLTAAAEQVKTFNSPPVKVPSFNPFILTDALLARDRKRLWLLFHQGRRAGLSAEEIFWKLNWQVKTLLLVAVSAPAAPAGIKPFVLTKTKSALKAWPLADLQWLFTGLTVLYHETYPESDDFNLGLEKIILTI